jgi:hypothetical protein
MTPQPRLRQLRNAGDLHSRWSAAGGADKNSNIGIWGWVRWLIEIIGVDDDKFARLKDRVSSYSDSVPTDAKKIGILEVNLHEVNLKNLIFIKI